MNEIILASRSPRRKEILESLGFKVNVVPSDYIEDSKETDPIKLAIQHATKKAKIVSEKHEGIILGFDTFVVYDNKVIGKPKDREDAIRILTTLSGTTHEVITGICITNATKITTDYETTQIKFRKLNNAEVIDYVDNNEVLDKAGAYAIQSKAYNFAEQIIGDYYNVVGLPVFKLMRMLNESLNQG